MEFKKIVFQLNEQNFHRLLWLVQRESIQSRIYSSYWGGLADNLHNQWLQQEKGEFFQCAACFEEGNQHATSDSVSPD